MGSQWQRLPPEEKKIYMVQAEEDKVRYIREVLKYNADNPDNIIHSRIQPPKGYKLSNGELIKTEEEVIDYSVKDKQPASSVDASFHRPLNAYGYYSRQEKQFLNELARNTSTNLQHAMGKRLAFRWSQMSYQEKKLYEELKNAYADV